MNPAVYGIVGVVVGAAGTGAIQFGLAARADRRAGRAAARLVGTEFVSATSRFMDLRRRCEAGEKVIPTWRLEHVYRDRFWEEYQAILASCLRRREWTHVENGVRNLRAFQDLYRGTDDAEVVVDSTLMDRINRYEQLSRKATQALQSVGGHPLPLWWRVCGATPGLKWIPSRVRGLRSASR